MTGHYSDTNLRTLIRGGQQTPAKHTHSGEGYFGWGGWTRTNTVLINSEVSYRDDARSSKGIAHAQIGLLAPIARARFSISNPTHQSFFIGTVQDLIERVRRSVTRRRRSVVQLKFPYARRSRRRNQSQPHVLRRHWCKLIDLLVPNCLPARNRLPLPPRSTSIA